MQYDVIIIGGGMVGASLACALQQPQLRIALVDAAPESNTNDPRLIALTHESCCLFKNLNIWPALVPHAEAIKQLHVSHRGHFGITRIQAKELNLDTLGHLIPAKYINAALTEKLKKLSNITIIRPATLKTLSLDDELTTLTLQTEKNSDLKLQGKIIIGADGTHSTVRQLLNIPIETVDYQQSAIVTITQLQRHHHNIAYERFLKHGAIAMLPLTEQRAATIWTDNNENIAELLQLTDEEFLSQLQKQFGYRLGRLKKIAQRHTYPLKLILAKESYKKNIVLIGNAAHTLHPVAAQGLNVALFEIAELAEKINPHSIHNVKDWLPNLNLVTSSRIKLADNLTKLFSSDFFMLNLTRQLGMLGLDFCLPAKNLFMQKAMGRTGKISHLLRE